MGCFCLCTPLLPMSIWTVSAASAAVAVLFDNRWLIVANGEDSFPHTHKFLIINLCNMLEWMPLVALVMDAMLFVACVDGHTKQPFTILRMYNGVPFNYNLAKHHHHFIIYLCVGPTTPHSKATFEDVSCGSVLTSYWPVSDMVKLYIYIQSMSSGLQ